MEDDLHMVASLQITQLEQEVIDAHYEGMTMTTIPRAADNAYSILGSISNTLVDHDLSRYMYELE